MDIDESKMEVLKEPSVWQKLKHSVIALLFGTFLLIVTPTSFIIIFLDNVTIYVGLCFYMIGCSLLGWFFGDNLINHLHAKIEDWWDPQDMFK